MAKKVETTEEWWDRVSNNTEAFTEWLKAQYHGEVTAAHRISRARSEYKLTKLEDKMIVSIVNDEVKHAKWIAKLLKKRNITPKILQKEERYWSKVLPPILTKEEASFKYFCAVGHLAETMRLDRIKLLAEDDRFEDIADVMKKIYDDEVFHARAFGLMSSKKKIKRAKVYHDIGKNAIGLVS